MKNISSIRRKTRTRSKVRGTSAMLRLSVYRSNKFLYAQIIDDAKGTTLVGVWEKELSISNIQKATRAKELGLLMAKKAVSKKVTKVVFDRGSYAYHGQVKQFAEGCREGGLVF